MGVLRLGLKELTEMKNRGKIVLRGEMWLIVRDAKTGKIIPEECQQVKNLIVNAGLYQIIDLIIGASDADFTHCGVGSGSTPPAAGDTDLQTPIGDRKVITERFRSTNKGTFSTFFGSADNNGTWRESGLFTALTGGTMLCRALLASAFEKTTAKTATVDWDITASAG